MSNGDDRWFIFIERATDPTTNGTDAPLNSLCTFEGVLYRKSGDGPNAWTEAAGSFTGGTVPDATTFEGNVTVEPDGILQSDILHVGEGGSTFLADQDGGEVGFFGAQSSQLGPINNPAGGATVDAEARTAINSILAALRSYGLLLDP